MIEVKCSYFSEFMNPYPMQVLDLIIISTCFWGALSLLSEFFLSSWIYFKFLKNILLSDSIFKSEACCSKKRLIVPFEQLFVVITPCINGLVNDIIRLRFILSELYKALLILLQSEHFGIPFYHIIHHTSDSSGSTEQAQMS